MGGLNVYGETTIRHSEDVTAFGNHFKSEEKEVRDMLGQLQLFQSLNEYELDSYRD